MNHRYAPSTLILAAALAACSGELLPAEPGPPVTPPPTVLLKDVVISNLPSPYYHFEYNSAGRVTGAAFASGSRKYEVTYDGDRIEEMREVTYLADSIAASHDRLTYAYDAAGRVSAVAYVQPGGVVFTRVFFSYDDDGRLYRIERQQRVTSGFIVDKTTSLLYYPDGNLLELTVHRPATDIQEEMTTVDLFGQYDDMVNVDDFGLIHDDFFDHLILLPGVRLQKGNPARVTRIGDGINYEVDYVYSYDNDGRPLAKSGTLTITNGSDAGQRFQIGSVFTYY